MAGSKARSTGVGESKRFGGGGADKLDWDAVTVDGRPVPEHMRRFVRWEDTDQGIAERNAKALEANGGRPGANVEIVRDEIDTDPGHFRDDLESGAPLDAILAKEGTRPRLTREQLKEMNKDPYAKLMAKHLKPGEHGMMLSRRKMEEEETLRGNLDYELVKDANGNPVKRGNMFLGKVPQHEFEAEQADLEQQNRSRIVKANENLLEAQERISGKALRKGNELGFTGIEQKVEEMEVGNFAREFNG